MKRQNNGPSTSNRSSPNFGSFGIIRCLVISKQSEQTPKKLAAAFNVKRFTVAAPFKNRDL
uniref:Uncharacterized protein n=1 Tax=Romanomermis culicivorax TaxID=13658 RepID=A0A915IQ62_ROMCU